MDDPVRREGGADPPVPELSVVVTVVDGGETLAECLAELFAQADPPLLEVLVPVDVTVPGVEALRARFPGARFLDLGNMPTARPVTSEAGRHELWDRRRAAGLAAARGEIVAMLEDRGVPRPDWARSHRDLHRASPAEVIGGAIENGIAHVLNDAVYFCDFGRQGLPLREGPAAFVSDINVSYKRAALASVSEVWGETYHETRVHDALRRAGRALILSSRPVVEQRRRGLRLAPLLRERFHWGRLFAATRVADAALGSRVCLALGCLVLPPVLWLRHLWDRLRRRRLRGRFLLATPVVVLLLVAWSLGELIGYVTRRR